MIFLENYLYDGEGYQARMVMCYLQSRVEHILDDTYTGDPWSLYEGKVFLNHYHYGREKGYVFSVRYKDKQANYAVYQHCISDCICLVKSNAFTDNSDGWDGKEWSKYDHTKEFSWDEVVKCGEWIEDDMRGEIRKWKKESEKKSYDEEKKALLNDIRNAVEENNGFCFDGSDDKKLIFHPIFCGEPREERIFEVYTEEGEEGELPYVVVVTTYIDESGKVCEERTNCEDFSNDEIREIMRLLNII